MEQPAAVHFRAAMLPTSFIANAVGDEYATTETMHGPTGSAERSDRPRYRGKSGAEIKRYFEERQRKLETQNIPMIESNIFKNVVVYITGFTESISYLRIKKTIQAHGGSVRSQFYPGQTTHVVCTNLAATKLTAMYDRLKSSARIIHIVRPEWILECSTQKKLLLETPYLVVPERSGRDIASYMVQPDNITELEVQESSEPFILNDGDKKMALEADSAASDSKSAIEQAQSPPISNRTQGGTTIQSLDKDTDKENRRSPGQAALSPVHPLKQVLTPKLRRKEGNNTLLAQLKSNIEATIHGVSRSTISTSKLVIPASSAVSGGKSGTKSRGIVIGKAQKTTFHSSKSTSSCVNGR